MFLYKVRSTCCGGLAEVMEAVVVGRSVSGKICVVVDSPTKWDLSLSRIANNAAAERIPNAKKGVARRTHPD